jgi:hypothetical protein
MSFYTDVITVYNLYSEGSPPFPPKIMYEKTVIRNVMWKNKTHVNSDNSGKNFICQTVSITIPLEAVMNKKFIPPVEYAAADKKKHWTLNVDKANPDIVVLGECDKEITDLYTMADLKRDYVTTSIHAVSDTTNQGILPMWKVSGV